MSLGCAETPSDLSRVAVTGKDLTRMWNIREDPAMVSFVAFSGVLAHRLLSQGLSFLREGVLYANEVSTVFMTWTSFYMCVHAHARTCVCI